MLLRLFADAQSLVPQHRRRVRVAGSELVVLSLRGLPLRLASGLICAPSILELEGFLRRE